MKALGVDLSLRRTGVAIAGDGGSWVGHFATSGHAGDDLESRRARLGRIVGYVTDLVDDIVPDLVVIEGPSHGQARQGGQHDRAGLWWLVVDAVVRLGVAVTEVAPAARARYATGRGNAAKDEVLAAVVRRHTDVDVDNNDQADALTLAAMGARALGCPIDDPMPKAHLAAMEKVAWPEVVA